jgi:hypothetical protein
MFDHRNRRRRRRTETRGKIVSYVLQEMLDAAETGMTFPGTSIRRTPASSPCIERSSAPAMHNNTFFAHDVEHAAGGRSSER